MTREEAREIVAVIKDEYCCGKEWKKAMDMAIEALKEPKKGEWILWNNPDDQYVRCTHCGTKFDQEDLYIGGCDYPNFCPNCGARMEDK